MGNKGFHFYFNFKISEKDFIELRDSIREEFLKLGFLKKENDFLYKRISLPKELKDSRIGTSLKREDINTYFSLFSNETEAWYCIYHNTTPYENKCCICGNITPFSDRGYLDVCSNKCRTIKRKQTCLEKYGVDNINKLEEIQTKKKENSIKKYGVDHYNKTQESKQKHRDTCLQRYGVEHYSKTKEFSDKFKQTCLEKYGVDNYSKTKESKERHKETCLQKYGVDHYSKTEEFTEKFRQTCLEKYGVDNYSKTKESKERHRETCLQKYGVDHYSKTEEFTEKFRQTCLEKYGVDNPLKNSEIKNKVLTTHNSKISQIEEENDCTLLRTLVTKYGQGWLNLTLNTFEVGNNLFIANSDIPKIEEYIENSPNSLKEIDVYDYCKTLVSENDIIKRNREIIAPKELDIYIPSKKVAIEFNGLYWHSKYDKTYHLNKTLECEKKGIRLIHIWEDLWESKQDIYKSIIASALGVYERKIYARNCECKEISSEEYRDFLERNHIQGSINSSIRLGLFYNGELVQVVGWGKSRFKKDEIELHRMCSKLNTQIIGGFSKLIKHSRLKEFISYVDRSLYDGKGYKASGFTVLGATPPSYFYYKNGKRLNRIQAQKHKLEKLLENFDASLSETENMLNNKYIKIFDCGNLKVKFRSNE